MSEKAAIPRTVLPIPDRSPVGLTTFDAKDPDTEYPPIEPLRPPHRVMGPLDNRWGRRAESMLALRRRMARGEVAGWLQGEGRRVAVSVRSTFALHASVSLRARKGSRTESRNIRGLGDGPASDPAGRGPGDHVYEPGTWGPPEADRLVADIGGWYQPKAAE